MTEIAILPKVELLFTPVVNYAIQQNRIPLVRKFSIENRSEIQGKVCEIKKTGADIDTTITKRTNFVITGSAPGPSKMKKIEKLITQGCDIRLVFEEEFLRMCGIKR